MATDRHAPLVPHRYVAGDRVVYRGQIVTVERPLRTLRDRPVYRVTALGRPVPEDELTPAEEVRA